MKWIITGLAWPLSYERDMKAAGLAKKLLSYAQEDRACRMDDGEKTIIIAPAPRGTIPQPWTSSGTCSCSSRRFGNSIAEILTLLRRISATFCAYFSMKTVTAIDAERWASRPTNSFNYDVPITFLRLRAAESGSTSASAA